MKRSPKNIHVIDTFDSGLGGMFTAHALREFIKESLASPELNIVKELARRGHYFRISHYGDTQNAPYGKKTANQIADFTTRAISYSLAENAERVFVACNTASTQIEAVRQNIMAADPDHGAEKIERVVSIIDKSAEAVAERIKAAFSAGDTPEELSASFLATGATVNSLAYPRAITERLKQILPPDSTVELDTGNVTNNDADGYSYVQSTITVSLADGGSKTIRLNQYAPHKWVDLIEGGADPAAKNEQVAIDIAKFVELFGAPPSEEHTLGLFCTHYPAVKNSIAAEFYTQCGVIPKMITQAELMLEVFKEYLQTKCSHLLEDDIVRSNEEIIAGYNEGESPISQIIYHITGDNIAETKRTLQTLFGADGHGQGETGITVEKFEYPAEANVSADAALRTVKSAETGRQPDGRKAA